LSLRVVGVVREAKAMLVGSAAAVLAVFARGLGFP
jgi:hypothetical protein